MRLVVKEEHSEPHRDRMRMKQGKHEGTKFEVLTLKLCKCRIGPGALAQTT